MCMGFEEYHIATVEEHYRRKMKRYDALPKPQRDRVKYSNDGSVSL